MRTHLHFYIITAFAFVLSALTIPMSFLGAVVDATAEYGTITNKFIRFIWVWGIDLTSDTKLSEPWAEVSMHAINFCIFFFVLLLGYRTYLLIRKLV